MALSADWKPDRDEIIAATAQNIAECATRPYYDNIRGFRLSPKNLPDDVYVWVKYGLVPEALRFEANTQYYVHDELLKMDNEIRQRFHVPKVFDFLETELDVKLYLMSKSCRLSYGIIVMEYVAGTAISRIIRELQREGTEHTIREEEQEKGGQTQGIESTDGSRDPATGGDDHDDVQDENLSQSDERNRQVVTQGQKPDYENAEDSVHQSEAEESSEANRGAEPVDVDGPALTPAEKNLQDKITFYKNLVADSISLLLSLPPPPDVSPGPVGGGLIMHWAFGKDDCIAPKEFASVEDLESFINEKITKMWPEMTPARITQEGLKLCYCDLNLDNFMLENVDDPSSRIIIIDFEHAGFLPYSFLTWELWDKREFDIDERVRSQSNLELHRDNVYAIHALLRVLTEESRL